MNIELLTPAGSWRDYELIDSGGFEKLERFGKYTVARPEPQAVWNKSLAEEEWRQRADAYFIRDRKSEERGEWNLKPGMPERWSVEYGYKEMKLKMRLGLTSFKHVGIFPEQAANWDFIHDRVRFLKNAAGKVAGMTASTVSAGTARAAGTTVPASVPAVSAGCPPVNVLNLFAYTGGATLAACSAGAEVTHVDSVKQVVTWARENMEASGLDGIRWIVEDALRFARREVKRGKKYHGIILDPPAYGRGTDGEKWVLEENINEMLTLCGELLDTSQGAFLVLNLYSMGMSALIAQSAVRQFVIKNTGAFPSSITEETGELYFNDSFNKALPLGVFYRFFR